MPRLKSLPLALAVLTLATAVLACGTGWGRHYSGPYIERACQANIRSLEGAIEMYNLDFNTNLVVLDEAMLAKLEADGYIYEVPLCPNRKARKLTTSGYVMARTGEDWDPRVACLDHGIPQDSYQFRPGTARESFAAVPGNEHLLPRALDRAADDAAKAWRYRQRWNNRFQSALVSLGGAPLGALVILAK